MKDVLLTIFYWVVIVATLSAMQGCAVITPVYDDEGKLTHIEATKFMADLAYKSARTVKYAPDGAVLEISTTLEMETRTNADRILDSATKLTGQLVEGASKAVP